MNSIKRYGATPCTVSLESVPESRMGRDREDGRQRGLGDPSHRQSPTCSKPEMPVTLQTYLVGCQEPCHASKTER